MAKKNRKATSPPGSPGGSPRKNRRITNAFEKQRKRKNVPESEYLTQMRDPTTRGI